MERAGMPRVIGVGDNVVDKYLHTGIMYPGGNALNFAVFAKKAGVDAAYLGSFGNDSAARHIQHVLRELSIDLSHCRSLEGDNGFARVTLVEGNRVFLPGNSGGVMRAEPLEFSRNDLEYIRTFQLIHSSCFSYIEPQLSRLKETGVPLSYDFSTRTGDEYLRTVCPFVDFGFFSAEESSDDASITRTLTAMHDLGCTVSAATMGKKGAILLYRGRHYHQGAEPITASDTMGAGDSFLTTFLLQFMDGCGWRSSGLLECSEADVEAALGQAAHTAAETCSISGSFGFGIPFKE